MKDSLKALIDQNRDSFDVLEPSPRLWHGISTGMGWRQAPLSIMLPTWLQAAAMLLFASGIVLFLFSKVNITPIVQQPLSSANEEVVLPVEIQEASLYYTGTLNKYLQEMETIKADTSKAGRMVYVQLQALDSAFTQLVQESVKSGGHERVFEALIMNYQMRIELLKTFLQAYPQSYKNHETDI